MTRLEHLLVIGAEEGVEVSQRFTKAARFGLDEVQPEQHLNNRQRILIEFADLTALMEMCGAMPSTQQDKRAFREMVNAKKAKVERFLEYSAEVGTLSADPLTRRPR